MASGGDFAPQIFFSANAFAYGKKQSWWILVKHNAKRLNYSLNNPQTDDSGYLEHLIAEGDQKSLLIFLLQTIPNTKVILNRFKGCIELYPLSANTESHSPNSNPTPNRTPRRRFTLGLSADSLDSDSDDDDET